MIRHVREGAGSTRRPAIPTYDYQCSTCDLVHEEDASMSSFRELTPSCPECGGRCAYIFTPTVAQVAFKDGPSGSWPSKGQRFQKYRSQRADEMSRRQRDRYGEPKQVVPNYQGQATENWREAQSLAMADKESHEKRGVDSISVGATYNAKISAEKK